MKKIKTVGDLTPAPYNPRRISKEQSQALGSAMREFGDLGGIVVNIRTGNLVGGHQRVKHLNSAWTIVKTVRADTTGTVSSGHIKTPYGLLSYREVDWPIEKEKAANLAANKHGGEFDMTGVSGILAELNGKFDLDVTGFLADERIGIFGEDKTINVDDVPESPKKTPIKNGDLYALGEHRLLCGDATQRSDWSTLFKFDKAAMCFTDPPYGVSYEGNSKPWQQINNDSKTGDAMLKLLSPAFKAASHHCENTAAFYIWHASSTREDFAAAIKSAGLTERQYLIWAKPGITLGHADYNWSHEPCFYACKAGQSPKFYGDRTQPTLWRSAISNSKTTAIVIGPGVSIIDGEGGVLHVQSRTPKNKKTRQIRIGKNQSAILTASDETNGTVWEIGRDFNYQHPTQKPVELARRAISNSSRKGEIVADPFLGSGTTLIAAEVTERICYGIEIDPVYVDVAIKRWEQFTKRKAIKK